MPSYKYVAKEPSGKTVTGIFEAETSSGVVDALRGRNLIVISVSEEKAKPKKAPRKKIKLDDLVVFSRQLATMVNAGIALVSSLDILCEQSENKSFAERLSTVRNDVETGASFSKALSKHPKIFSGLYISMVRAGETSGALDDILDRLATYLEKANALQKKLKSSMIYPSLVVSMAVLITGFLIVKVIPTFKGIFKLLGGDLPMPTQVLILISDVVRHYLPHTIGILFLFGVLATRYIRTETGRLRFDRLLLRLPVVGILFRKVAVAKFARTLSTLVRSGVPILGSLEIVSRTSGNKVIEKAIDEARLSIREGESIAGPLARSGVFPPMVVRMVSVGEQTGELEKMLSKIADFYEEQVDAAVSGLTSLIEPVIIIFLGIVIGGIVLAMFMPIFKLTEIIGR